MSIAFRVLLAVGLLVAAAPAAGSDPAVALAFADGASSDAHVRAWNGAAWSDLGARAFGSEAAWQVLRYGARNNELALVCLNDQNELELQVRVGGSWTGPTRLTADCGTAETRPFAAEYERSSGTLLVAYRKANRAGIYYRTATGGVVSPESSYSGMGLSQAPRWVHLSARPGSDEMVLLAATETGLSAAVWNGSSFGNPITLSTSMGSGRRAFGAAYMTGSGRALAAWGEASGALRYRVWDGSAWSAPAAAPSIGQAAWWLALAADVRSGSDRIVLACSDDGDDGEVMVWDGSSFGSALRVEETLGSASARRIDAAFARDGTAVVAWQRSGEERLRYRVWDGAGWSAPGAGPALPAEPRAVVLATGAGEEDVFAAVMCGAASTPFEGYAIYSEHGATVIGWHLNAEGDVGAQVAGVSLPPAPSETAGGADVIAGHNESLSLQPGVYGELNLGHNVQMRLRAGTYVFSRFEVANNVRVTADTSDGDVRIIVTAGDFAVGYNFILDNTGAGVVDLHVTNGNADVLHNGSVEARFFVYNGKVNIGHVVYVRGGLFASGNIEVLNNCTVIGGSGGGGGARTSLSTMSWSAGVPDAAAHLAGTLPGGTEGEPFALATPAVRGLRITRWREVEPD